MQAIWILGIYLPDREHKSEVVQSLLTKFGCSIRTRLGLHEVTEDKSFMGGIILLEMIGEIKEIKKLEKELSEIQGLIVKKMIFKQE
jgi:hypothetical protein